MDVSSYAARLGKLSINETKVAKVTTDRAYGLAVMPSASSVVAAVGDKSGNLGIWNYSHQHMYPDTDGVTQFTPHTATVNVVSFCPVNPSKVYSTSYDGTVRCVDLHAPHSGFQLAYATPQTTSYDRWLQHSCVTPDGRGLLLGDSEGIVTAVDLRSNKVTWHADCHDKKVQTVSVNPCSPHYLATASLDRSVKIFDLRLVPATGKKGSARTSTSDKDSADLAPVFEPVCSFVEGNSVNCAYWNPTGSLLLSVTQGDHLRVFRDPHTGFAGDRGAGDAAAVSVRHDNKTGRYLPVFHAGWDPKCPSAFVMGSMNKQRQVEVFHVAQSTPAGGSKHQPLTCSKVAALSGECLASVQSRNAFHPFLDVVVCANASGRVHIFD